MKQLNYYSKSGPNRVCNEDALKLKKRNLSTSLSIFKSVILLATLFSVTFNFANAQTAFNNNSLAILVSAASANNTTVSVVEIDKTTAGQSAIQTISIPGTGTDAIRVSSSATSTLYAANTNDGSLFCFTGANSTNTSSNVNTLNPRAVVTLNNAGTIVLQTTYTGISGNQTRGATSINNSNWFIGDQGGFYTNGASTASPTGNIRSVKSFGGTVYAFTASSSAPPVGILSAPSGGTYTGLPGLANGNSSRQDFYFISSGSNGSAYDVLYVLDATSVTAGTIFKYSLVSGSWTANGSYTTNFGGFGLAAEQSGAGANLYVSSGTGSTTANKIVKLFDNTGYNTTINITTANNITLYTTPAGTIIKGVAFAPQALTPTISFTGTLSALSTTYGTASSNTSFGVSGSGMTAGITITPPVGFEVSTTADFSANIGSNSSPLIVGAAGTINSTTVYVRLLANAQVAGSPFSGDIVLTSSGATTVNVATVSSTVAPKELTITGITADSKVFDGTTTATISGTPSLVGVVAADISNVTLGGTVVADFASSAVANNIPVTVSGYTISGSAASNYTLTQPAGLTANITSAALLNQTITFNPLTPVTYGDADFNLTATASSGLTVSYTSSDLNIASISGNTVTIEGAGTVTITASQSGDGTYNPAPSVPQTLTVNPKELTVTGSTPQNKVYDRTTTATISGSTLADVVGADDVALSGGGVFADVNVGTAKSITTSYSLVGADIANYTLTQPTGLAADITPKDLTITGITVNSKSFDGNTTATLSGTAALSGIVSGDAADVVLGGTVVANFTSSAIGNNIPVTVSGYSISGAASGNYSLSQPTGLTGNILAPSTVLAAGDIAIIGYNTSGSPDNFAILVLKDLTEGTSFFINDNEIATPGGATFTDLNEGEASFTVKAGQTITAGTVIVLPWGAAAVSTATYDFSSTTGAGLGNNNEEIYIYTAPSISSTTATTFIYFAEIGSSTSSIPAGLLSGSTAIAPTGTASRYATSGALYSSCPQFLLNAIANTATHWNTTGATTIAPGDWSFTVLPVCPIVVDLSVSVNTGTEADSTQITISATASSNVLVDETVDVTISGTNITNGDYTLSNAQITILAGTNQGTVILTVVDDVDLESDETATISINNPSSGIELGTTISQNILIIDNDAVVNLAPSILVDVTATSDYIDGSAIASPASPYAFSGVISDPTDPAATLGFHFTVNDAETAASALTVTAISSNTTVVPSGNLSLTGLNETRILTISPTSVGYSTITVTVSDGVNSTDYVISYAASAAATSPAATRFHFGRADASTSVMIDANYMLVADDENQALRLYNRNNSGLNSSQFDYTSSLGLTDFSGGIPREVDIESSTKVGSRIYWLGSHDNSSSGSNRPNRSRVFATDISGSGSSTTLSYVGRYDGLKTDLLNWDATNGHGLGADYFGLVASAAVGVIPEAADGSGFNIEGLEMAPDNTTAYVCFRAPIVPVTSRTKALIVPVTNFTALFSANPTTGINATFGTPIELNLGGRGIREIKKNASGQYIIIAGPVNAATDIAPSNFVLYAWSGDANDAPYALTTSLSSVSVVGSYEGIVSVPDPLSNGSTIQLSVDNGDAVYYNDAIIAKDLSQSNFKKSTSLNVTISGVIDPASAPVITTITPGNQQLSVAFTPPTSNGGSAITDYKYSTDGGVSFVSAGTTSSPLVISGLTNGVTYMVQILAVNLVGDGAPSSTVNGTPELPVVSTITVSTATLSALTTTYGMASAADSFVVSGTFLTGDLTIVAPVGFEISAVTDSTGYSDTITFTPNSGLVSDTTVFVRLKDTAIVSGSYDSQIVALSSPGATTVNISTAPAGNSVSPKSLSISGLTVDTKVYDGSISATFTGTGGLTGIVGTDDVTLSGAPTVEFANKNAGIAKVVLVSGYELLGTDSANYTLLQQIAGDITPAPLTISGAVAQSKQYDGTTNAILTGTLNGIISSDVVTLIGTGTFASPAVGTGISVTSTSTLGGADSANYEINPQPTGLTADITPGPTVLTVGDLSIIGFNLNAPDNFAFVTWVDLIENTIIKFTDNGFLSTAPANQASNARGGENFVIWKNNSGITIPAGTVITIQDNGTSATNFGTIVSGNLSGLSASGDNIFAYQGAALSGSFPDWSANSNPTTFNGTILFGLYAQGSSSITSWLSTGTASSNATYLPTELNVAFGNVALASNSSKGQYTGSRNNQLSMSAYKAMVTDTANWTKASGAGPVSLDVTPFTISSGGPTASVISNGTGQDTVCAGSPANIQVTITGGLSPYTVVINDGTADSTYTSYVSGTDISVEVASTTTFTLVSVTDANNQSGIGNSGSAVITLDTTLAFILPSDTVAICGNDSILLSAPSSINYSYLWTTGETTSTIYASEFQQYGVTITNLTTGCISTTGSASVTVINSMPTDFNGSGVTDISDFLSSLGKLNTSCTCLQDLNGDGVVNINDFLGVLANLNVTCN